MALPSILRNSTPSVSDQLADLQARVNAQGLEIARLSRELGALKAMAVSNSSIAVERSGCALIADRLGINERTVRGALTSHAHFARVREACALRGSVITRDRAFLAWLADNLEQGWPK
jgi:hypothetical protein